MNQQHASCRELRRQRDLTSSQISQRYRRL